jgi:TRAP-type C4-dicarboxylate transport system substrate-binding protein
MRGWWILAGLLACASARGEVTLRMAAIAPDGTAWARELKALDRDLFNDTGGAVRMKWYLGGIAGDELTALERVRKGQLDGMAGAQFCPRLAPSLWVTRLVGIFHDRNEGRVILNRLHPTAEKEMEQQGFVSLGEGPFGAEIIFTREPVRSMADLRRTRVWTWSLDDFWVRELPAMGVRSVALPIEDAAAAYDGHEIDGFIAVPTAALAYRWSAQAKYFSELSAAVLPGCIVVSRRAFDQLTIEQQKMVRAATAKFIVRFLDLGDEQERRLLHGLFEHQGLKRVEVSREFLEEFRQAADKAREKLGDSMLREKKISPTVLTEVLSWLSEMRAAHSSK